VRSLTTPRTVLPTTTYATTGSLQGAREVEQGECRGALFDAQDEIDRRGEQLINETEGKLEQRVTEKLLFSIRWTLL